MANFAVNDSAELFIGFIPRLSPFLVEKGHGSYARDISNESGALSPFRNRKHIAGLENDAQTLWVKDCCMDAYAECGNIADGDNLCFDFYATGFGEFPLEGRFDEDCGLTWRRLGIPCPTNQLTLSAPTTVGSELAAPRAYAYSYINSNGNEGILSAGSNIIVCEDSVSVTISGWIVPAPEWEITHVKLYRAISGALGDVALKATEMGTNVQDSAWMLVGEAQINALAFVDSKAAEELTQANSGPYVPPPPEGLQGIINIGVQNTWAGFIGESVYFSKNNNADAWPHRFQLEHEDKIRGIAAAGGKVYVMTDGHPYMIDGMASCDDAGRRNVVRAQASAPAANLSPRGITAVGSGAVYPSHTGLMYIDVDGSVTNVTDGFYSEDDWGKLLPNSMMPVWYKGDLLVFGRYKSLRFSSMATMNGAWRLRGLTELSDIDVRDWKLTPANQLFLLTDTAIVEWEGDSYRRPYLWRSQIFNYTRPVHYSAFYIDIIEAGEVTVRVFADDRKVYERTMLKTQSAKLPSWGWGKRWYYELEGIGTVGRFSFAKLWEEL